MSAVVASCITLSFSTNFTGSARGSVTNSFGVMKGPIGAKVSCDLPISQSEP